MIAERLEFQTFNSKQSHILLFLGKHITCRIANGHATKDGSVVADGMRCECARFCSPSAAVPS
eukprot:1063852-Pelagomonas_calceolata.AAC.1